MNDHDVDSRAGRRHVMWRRRRRPPDDDWLSIAETFEYLPAEE